MTTRMRARTANGETQVLVLVRHPMESGLRTDPDTGETVPPHFIQKMTFSVNGKEVAVADLGFAVARDPLIKIKLPAAKPGDRIRVVWSDNRGRSGQGAIEAG